MNQEQNFRYEPKGDLSGSKTKWSFLLKVINYLHIYIVLEFLSKPARRLLIQMKATW